ncbi:MAG: extracellular catalytic domain type 1 short-chain-length polyhydroxyalkanoate depolymerase, partial [Burkholderiales bacterium]
MKFAVLAVCVLLGAAPIASMLAGEKRELAEVTDFGANPGSLGMEIYLPSQLGNGAPLVVVAHGCFQTVQMIFDHSGWVELSDRYGFALLFPQTSTTNEPFGGCFRTWYPEHQGRDQGEPLSIRNQIAWLVDHYRIDPERIYMTGQSSGGLETAVMLATYPELFVAGAIQSAYPYRCADTFEELASCSKAEHILSAAEWGNLVRAAAPDYEGPRPPVALWHGAADTLLVPANLDLQLQQWANVFEVDTQSD